MNWVVCGHWCQLLNEYFQQTKSVDLSELRCVDISELCYLWSLVGFSFGWSHDGGHKGILNCLALWLILNKQTDIDRYQGKMKKLSLKLELSWQISFLILPWHPHYFTPSAAPAMHVHKFVSNVIRYSMDVGLVEHRGQGGGRLPPSFLENLQGFH